MFQLVVELVGSVVVECVEVLLLRYAVVFLEMIEVHFHLLIVRLRKVLKRRVG